MLRNPSLCGRGLAFAAVALLLMGCSGLDPAPPLASDQWDNDLAQSWTQSIAQSDWRRAAAVAAWWEQNLSAPRVAGWEDQLPLVTQGVARQVAQERWQYETEYDSQWALTQNMSKAPDIVLTLRSSPHLGNAVFWSGKSWVCPAKGCNVRVSNDQGLKTYWRIYPHEGTTETVGLAGLDLFFEAAQAANRLTIELPTSEGAVEASFDVSGLNRDFVRR
jgi:hypothetical protein